MTNTPPTDPYAARMDSYAAAIPTDININNPLDMASLGQLVKNELPNQTANLQSQAQTLTTSALPSTPLPTPTPGTPLPNTNSGMTAFIAKGAVLANDVAKTAEVVVKGVEAATKVVQSIQQVEQAVTNTVNQVKTLAKSLTSRELKLYGAAVIASIAITQIKASKQIAKLTKQVTP